MAILFDQLKKMGVLMSNFGRFKFFKIMGRQFSGLAMIAAVLVMTVSPEPVRAQDTQAMLDRIDRLERDIRALNIFIAQGQSGTAPELSSVQDSASASSQPANSTLSNASVARIDARIASLENDVRVATGAMEELDHRIFQITSKLDKYMADMDFRMSSVEQGIANPSFANNTNTTGTLQSGDLVIQKAPAVKTVTTDIGQTSSGVLGTITETQLQQVTTQDVTVQGVAAGPALSPEGENTASTLTDPVVPTPSTTPAVPQVPNQNQSVTQTANLTPVPSISPQEEYTAAFGLLRQAKYDDAANALQAFIDKNTDNPLVANARYWLGETYYVRSQFVRAAEVFFEGYRENPTGAKAPDTLLKLGMSLSNLGKKPEACAAFAKLAGEFTDASASVRTTMQREQLRNECL